MDTTLKKHSVVIGGRKTSISLEDSFWASLMQIASERATPVSEVIRTLDRDGGNLSSTIRVFIVDHYRNKCRQHSAEPS